MTGYTKLFGSIVASTIWDEDNETRIVWITMLAMANKFGIVESSLPGLAKFARVPFASTQKALQKFMSPDPYSRSKEHEGRRIEEVDGGWRILNHSKYRERLSPADRREYLRLKQREHRAKAKPCQQPSTNSETSTNCLLSTQAEAEAEAKTESEAEADTSSYKRRRIPASEEEAMAMAAPIGGPPEEVKLFYNHYEASGWVDGNGNRIMNGLAKLVEWLSKSRERQHQDRSDKSSRGERPLTVHEMRVILEAKQAEAKEIKDRGCAEVPMGTIWTWDFEKEKYLKLTREIKELRSKIGDMA